MKHFTISFVLLAVILTLTAPVQATPQTVEVVVVVPHPDDEAAFIPLLQRHDNATVLVMTDGAVTGYCPVNGMAKGSAECVEARLSSITGFLNDTVPHARMIWMGYRDATLTEYQVERAIARHCDDCLLFGTGNPKTGHRDHLAVHAAVEKAGGFVWQGNTISYDPDIEAAARKWYGWLGGWRVDRFLGIIGISVGPMVEPTIMGGEHPSYTYVPLGG